ncbi:putative transcription factor interactor and regulator CCHC(Zn) family [Helianthus anomalus]
MKNYTKKKIEAQRKDIVQLKEDLSAKNCNFLDALATISDLTKELEDLKVKYQVNEIHIKKFDTSSNLVKNICDIQLEYKERKGAGLGYTKTPPPYNHNYTYMPFTEEELINEGKMTYGPKTDKSSINNKFVDNKRPAPSMNFVSKGTVDPNSSVACADEIEDSKCEDSIGDEQASESDSFENIINEPNPDSILACSIFNSVFSSVFNFRPNGLSENVDACVTATESEDETNEPAEPSDSNCDSSEVADYEKLESVDSSEFSSRVSCAEPSCAENSSNVSAEVSAKFSGISSDKPELSNSVKADDMKEEVNIDVTKAPSAQAEQSEPSVSDEKAQIKQQEPKKASKGRGKKKPKHQRQAGSPQSSTGSNSPQKARDKNQKQSPPQKSSANNKYRHPNSSSFARNVQGNQAQKGPVRPSGSSRANPADQNAFYIKRQTCFNCGIAGHIARNYTNRPYVPYYMQNQRVTPKGNYHSKPMKVSSPKAMKNVNSKVKPSDGDWNAAKNKRKAVQEQKSVFKTNKPEPVKVAQPKATNTFVKPKQIWKPKSKAAMPPILEIKGDLCLKEVSYFDASGNPRTTMAWVPMSY